jgi:hypothetical protein
MISKCHIDRRALEIRKPEIGQGVYEIIYNSMAE